MALNREVVMRRGALWGLCLVAGIVALGMSSVDSVAEQKENGKGWTLVFSAPLPGRTTRFDYQSLDPATGRLFIAHLGDGRLVVFDTAKRKVVADIPGFPHVHGVLAVASRHRVYATVSPLSRKKTGRLVVLDSATLRRLADVPVGIHPDGLDYEATTDRIFVSNEWEGSLSVVDAGKNKIVGTIPLGGEIGNTRVDPVEHRVWAAVQTRNLLVGVDPGSLKIVRRISLPCDHPHGLLILGERHLALVACEHDARLLGVDLGSGRVLFRGTTGTRPDVLSFDPGTKRLYVASESGVVGVYRVGAHLEKLSERFMARHAHSILVDPRGSLVYLPLEEAGGSPLLRIFRWEGR